jgi:uncharacterized protein involved in outer membrane biogenesis
MKRVLKGWWDHPKRNRYLIIFAAIVLLYTLIGFFAVPAIVKSQLVKRLPAFTQRKAAVRQVLFNPYVLSLTVRGLELTEPNGEPFASWEEFYANFQLSSIPRFAWTFDEISFKEPRLQVAVDENGKLNLANLGSTKPTPPSSKPSALPRLRIFRIGITNGAVAFEDRTRHAPFKTTYTPINFSLNNLTTHRDADAPLSFSAESDTGRHVDWAGNVNLRPLRSSGRFEVNGIQLARFAPYVEDFTKAQLTNGVLAVSGQYRVAQLTNAFDATLSDFAMDLTDLTFMDPDSKEVLLSVPAYTLRGGSADLRKREARIASFEVSQPSALIRRMPDGTINFVSLMASRLAPRAKDARRGTDTNSAPSVPKGGKDARWVFSLDHYTATNAQLTFRDEMTSPEFVTVLTPLSVDLRGFTTRHGSNAVLQAEFKTEANETISLAAQYSFEPAQGAGTVTVSQIHLPKYQPYLAPFFSGTVRQGKADAKVQFSAGAAEGKLEAAADNGRASVSGLEIAQGDEPVFSFASFTIEDLAATLSDRSARVGALRTREGKILARRNPDKTINLLALLKPGNAPTSTQSESQPQSEDQSQSQPQRQSEDKRPSTNPAPAGGGWKGLINEIAVTDYQIRFEDRAGPKTADVVIDDLDLGLRNIQFPSNAPMSVEMGARMAAGGDISVKGAVLPYTQQADLEVRVAGLALQPFQPYVEPFLRVEIPSGQLDVQGHAALAGLENTNAPFATFQGDVGITNFLLTDEVLFKDFVRWTNVAIAGIDLKLQPNEVKVRSIEWDGLTHSVIIGPDKRMNLSTVLPPREAGSTSTSAPAGPGTKADSAAASSTGGVPMAVQVDQLTFRNGSLHFTDQSLQPPCTFSVKEFNGTIRGLSSAPDAAADLEITGNVDEQAPFSISGKVSPLSSQLMADLVFTNANMQLSSFTPYMEKYGGHPLNRGKLSSELRYSLRDKAVKADNKVIVDQLMLGPKNDSPDATKLPVKLGMALLKDINGQIILDVPVEGRTDDPQFAVAPIVFKVVMNMITKAIASPFTLLGALVGGGGEEMSFVEFTPGTAEIPEKEQPKLDKLAAALEKRPALSLEIGALLDPAADKEALAVETLRETVRAARLKELADAGKPVPAADQFQLEPREYQRRVLAVHERALGANSAQGGTSDGTNSFSWSDSSVFQTPKAQKRGFLQKLFGGGDRDSAVASSKPAKEDSNQSTPAQDTGFTAIERQVANAMPLPEEKVQDLLKKRAEAVQSYLIKTGKVTPDRLFILAPKPDAASTNAAPRVVLSLG